MIRSRRDDAIASYLQLCISIVDIHDAAAFLNEMDFIGGVVVAELLAPFICGRAEEADVKIDIEEKPSGFNGKLHMLRLFARVPFVQGINSHALPAKDFHAEMYGESRITSKKDAVISAVNPYFLHHNGSRAKRKLGLSRRRR
jgi:hypothetical protein